jgi:hypothetical protein
MKAEATVKQKAAYRTGIRAGLVALCLIAPGYQASAEANCAAQAKTLSYLSQGCTLGVGAGSYSCAAATHSFVATCTKSGLPAAYAECFNGTLYQVNFPVLSTTCYSGDGGTDGDNDEARDDLIWSRMGKPALSELIDRSLREGTIH